MIVAIIVLLLMLSAMSDWAEGEDWERSERNAERRHRELMKATRNKGGSVHRARRTRVLRDERGRFMKEEVVLEGDFDED